MEIWKAIDQHYGPYEVSNLGNVRRIGGRGNKALTISAVGYHVVNLWKSNNGKVLYVHRLVAKAFVDGYDESLCINHKDGNKTNNVIENLECVTLAENNKHARETGLCDLRGEKNVHAKLTLKQAQDIKRRALSGERTCDLAREFKLNSSTVSQIKHGDRWKHLD